jgi:hypothetical protein
MALTRPKYSQIYDADWKQSARVATVGSNITLTGGAPATLDNVNLQVNDRVLVKDQTTGSQNGIYIVQTLGSGSNGTWIRSLDANQSSYVTAGMTIIISEGTVNAYATFKLTTADPITLGTTSLTFVNTAAGATVQGSDKAMQYNDNGAFGGATTIFYNKTSGNVYSTASTTSTSTTTGALVVSGGVGIGGALYNGGVHISQGNIVAASGTISNSTTTGALIVVGGAGVSGNVYIGTNLNVTGNITTGNITGNLLPYANVTYNLGSSTQRWKDLYLSGSTIYLNTASISATAGKVTFTNDTGGSFSVTGSVSGQSTGTFGNLVANSGIASSNTTTGALQVTGGAGVSGAVYAGSLYDNSNRVVSTSSGAGNLTINSTAINLTATGPGATTVGSSSAIPIVTTDVYGRVTALSTASISTTLSLSTGGNGSGSGSVALASQSLVTSGGTGISVSTSNQTVTITNTGVVSLANTADITSNVASGSLVGMSLTTSGVTAGVYGSSTSIPQLTIDTKGRVTLASNVSVSTTINLAGGSGTGSVAGGGTLTVSGSTGLTTSVSGSTITLTNSGVTSAVAGTDISVSGATGAVTINDTSTLATVTGRGATTSTAVTFSGGLTVPSITKGGVSGTGDIGASGATFGTVWAKATSAQYADLAENYVADENYPPGTVVVFGGAKEITVTTVDHDPAVAGVISTNPAYLMNATTAGLPVALQGRVPCRVQGPVYKGQVLVTSSIPGVAQAIENAKFVPGCVIGKALEAINTNNIETIEVVVGRT